MRMLSRTALLFIIVFSTISASAGEPKSNLVSVEWLEKNLKNPKVLILDASSAPLYAASHVPGAVNASPYGYGAFELPLSEMERRLQAFGVSPGKKIVIYDEGGSNVATRLFWDLHYHGYPAADLFILNGGLNKWKGSGLPVSKEPTPVAKGTFRISRLKESERIRLPEVLTATGDPVNNAVIDALDPSWYYGQIAPFGRSGHIPNGILLPGGDFYNADKTFKSPAEIKKMLDYMGVKPGQQISTYCGGGIAATVPYFALKFILGYPDVKLYKESELGWVKDERGLPFWTYESPNLMRDAGYIQGWNSRMLRMFAQVNVSLIDIRPADEYAQGHIPFTLNIPADSIKAGFSDPANLPSLLGPAGVDQNLEAVIISGAGVTKEAALAFLLLERSGQKNVSIFTDSLEAAAKRGLASTKDATVVAPKKAANDIAIPPTTYTATQRSGLIITDAKSTQGVYPKVFIASGATAPSAKLEGTVVHVPYTDLLNADGSPKAAKDIWNVLARAGVPRYAELITFSDDPGEAAANYYILKLMGFPDVKVLVR
jgi:thiosulfate/3-mercaptopyruvate sulfurtransferase